MTNITHNIDPAMLEMALDQSFNAVLMTDANSGEGGHRIVYVNAAFCRMTGYSAGDLLGRNPRMLQGPATNPDVIERLRECLREGVYFHGSTINYRKDGRPYTVEWNISPVRNLAGAVTHFISVQQDVSSLMASQKSMQLFAHVLNATDDGVLITDSEGVIEFANKGFEKITGYKLTEVLGRNPSMLKSGEQDTAFYQRMWATLKNGNTFRGTFINCTKDQRTIHCDEAITPLMNEAGEITHYVSIFRDHTTRVLEEQQFRAMVRFDGLTGALTRAAGELALEKAYMQAKGSGLPMSIAIADIDHFKQVNDTWGHSCGDAVLKAVARSLTATLRANDSVIRWGGEEFLLIFSGCELPQALPLAERCRSGLMRVEHDRVGQVTLSMGVGELQRGETLAQLIERVDQVLYAAKHGGRNQVMVSTA
ncbi:sensor domain-containing diguanylate cyclase [Vogesella urethralis]|uniref:sensor domain-containing diguanylate cyclase n=1 Tax=Vogesella urethralis TaxID=2592656 RepID=UPI00118597EB|nr:sensor domain-containing diguanylate cyclase [Vogesella urethralis]